MLREIEQLPNEREQEEYFFMDDPAEFGSGRIAPSRYTGGGAGGGASGSSKKHSSSGKNAPNVVKKSYPLLVVHYAEQDVLCGDGCPKAAITFGIKC